MNKSTRMYFHPVYIRLWHWLQAASILMLLATGLAIHFPEWFGLIALPTAVAMHNVAGLVLVGNGLLALFYHLATGEIRQFVPSPRECFPRAVAQARWYMVGIFRGEPHPFPRNPEQKFSPLQKLAYLALLNMLLPAQALTGLMLLSLQQWPDAVDGLGGLTLWATVHTAVAWLFTAFLIGHLYMITTGPTPVTYLKTMISGWEKAESKAIESGEPV
jgi:thiosulfate reductase cytochrome b subunit